MSTVLGQITQYKTLLYFVEIKDMNMNMNINMNMNMKDQEISLFQWNLN